MPKMVMSWWFKALAADGTLSLGSRAAASIHDEAVADAGLGQQQLRTRGLALELAPQVAHVDVEILRLRGKPRPPRLLEELLMGDDTPRVLHEGGEKLVLDRGQVNLSPIDQHLTAHEVHTQIPRFKNRNRLFIRSTFAMASCDAHAGE